MISKNKKHRKNWGVQYVLYTENEDSAVNYNTTSILHVTKITQQMRFNLKNQVKSRWCETQSIKNSKIYTCLNIKKNQDQLMNSRHATYRRDDIKMTNINYKTREI